MSDHRKKKEDFINLWGKAIIKTAQLDDLAWNLDGVDLMIADGVRLEACDRFLIFTNTLTNEWKLIDRRWRDSRDVSPEDRIDYHTVGEKAFRR